MDFSADCTILTAMISRVQSYEKLKINFPGILHDLEYDTLTYTVHSAAALRCIVQFQVKSARRSSARPGADEAWAAHLLQPLLALAVRRHAHVGVVAA